MRLCVLGFVLAVVACSSVRTGSLENTACNAGCDEAKQKCNSECAEEADQTVCEVACTEAEQKCLNECKN